MSAGVAVWRSLAPGSVPAVLLVHRRPAQYPALLVDKVGGVLDDVDGVPVVSLNSDARVVCVTASEAACSSGWDIEQQNGLFSVPEFLAALQNPGAAAPLLCTRVCPSTQSLLHLRLAALPAGSVLVADQQSAGRGRGGNTWTSPLGCLMCSFRVAVPSSHGASLPFLQYVVSLVLAETAASFPGASSVDVRLKWPNDLYTSTGEKLGGVIAEVELNAARSEFDVTVGFGINVSNAAPTTCLHSLLPAASVASVTREALLARFLDRLDAEMPVFLSQGFTPFQQRYLDTWLHTGQAVTLADGSRAVITGLSATGMLQATDDVTGIRCELHPNHTSLDWLAGLVRRKV